MKASLHRHNWLNNWLQRINSTSRASLQPQSVQDWKFPPCNYTVGSFGNQTLSCGYLGAFQKSPQWPELRWLKGLVMTNKRHEFVNLITLKISRVLGALYQRWVQKPIFLIIIYNITKGHKETFFGSWKYVLPSLRCWCYRYMEMSKITQLHTLNLYSWLYFNYASVNLQNMQ